MANEFKGNLIRHISDLLGLAPEKDILGVVADQTIGVPHSVQTFADLFLLDPAKHQAVIDIANHVIYNAETMLEGYARSYGYALPLVRSDGSPDPIAQQVALALTWIEFRQRRNLISEREAELERDRIQRGELTAISKGALLLDVARAITARSSHVHAVTSSPRTFSREKLEGL